MANIIANEAGNREDAVSVSKNSVTSALPSPPYSEPAESLDDERDGYLRISVAKAAACEFIPQGEHAGVVTGPPDVESTATFGLIRPFVGLQLDPRVRCNYIPELALANPPMLSSPQKSSTQPDAVMEPSNDSPALEPPQSKEEQFASAAAPAPTEHVPQMAPSTPMQKTHPALELKAMPSSPPKPRLVVILGRDRNLAPQSASPQQAAPAPSQSHICAAGLKKSTPQMPTCGSDLQQQLRSLIIKNGQILVAKIPQLYLEEFGKRLHIKKGLKKCLVAIPGIRVDYAHGADIVSFSSPAASPLAPPPSSSGVPGPEVPTARTQEEFLVQLVSERGSVLLVILHVIFEKQFSRKLVKSQKSLKRYLQSIPGIRVEGTPGTGKEVAVPNATIRPPPLDTKVHDSVRVLASVLRSPPPRANGTPGKEEESQESMVARLVKDAGHICLQALPKRFCDTFSRALRYTGRLSRYLLEIPGIAIVGTPGSGRQEAVFTSASSGSSLKRAAAISPSAAHRSSKPPPRDAYLARKHRHFENWHIGVQRPIHGEKPTFNYSPCFERPLPRFDLPRVYSNIVHAPPTVDHYAAAQQIDGELQRQIGISEATAIVPGLSLEAYTRRLQHLLWVEELQMQIDIRQYDIEATIITPDPSPRNFGLYVIAVPGLAEKRPSVLRGDRVYARQSGGGSAVHVGYVHYVNLDDVRVSFHDSVRAATQWDVQFTYGRSPLRLMHRAVSEALSILFTSPSLLAPPAPPQPLPLFNGKLNAEQVAAVRGALTTERSSPLIVFGPPGTGKTVTLVEAILQVVCLRNRRILLTAPSNEAVDLLCSRLLSAGIDPLRLCRLNAQMRDPKEIRPELRPCCTPYYSGAFTIPPADFYERFAVVATTCCSAGYLTSVAVPPGFFSHIFADEAAQALEPEALIPLQLALPGQTTVVLAGDPRQLGPIIRSPAALRYGLDRSLLERLVDASGSLCADVVRLRRSYRSHPAITAAYAQLFYEGDLEAMRPAVVDWRLAAVLPNPQVPLLFRHIEGRECRDQDSPSWYNEAEIGAVLQLVDALLLRGVGPAEIAVVAPYRKQVQKFRGAIHDRGSALAGLEVGTVEHFQGSEHHVVIVSAVRSSKDYVAHDKKFQLGFMSSPKRLNVAISRAQAMLAIFGNAQLLATDPLWFKLIAGFVERGAYDGPPLQPAASAEPGDALLTIDDMATGQNVDPEWRIQL